MQPLRQIALEVFKIVNHVRPKYLQRMFQVKESTYNIRGEVMLNQPKFKTVKYGRESITYEGARLWNLLPNNFKEYITVKRILNI